MSLNPLISTSPSRGSHSRTSSRSSSPSSSYNNHPPPSSSSHHNTSRRSRRRNTRRVVSTFRRIERGICTLAKLFPLTIVYSGQTWAVYTEAWSISFKHMGGLKGAVLGTLGFVIYGLAVWSYTTAVFRDPGSPMTNKHSYSHLPTTEPSASFPSGPITVKSSGTPRFCKKCQCRKPDRAHHCSTCNRCVLRMDHHCPWLATCLGLRNYKPFLLFLIYTSLLCILSFVVSTSYIYATIFSSDDMRGGFAEGEEITPVNWILLATISGIIGLVLSGFTIWHIMLASSGMTTIESLEKVRYSNPAIFSAPQHPGMNSEGGVSDWSADAERTRAQVTYQTYLDDEQLAKLPHAFDLGRKQNLKDVFGVRRWAWMLPLGMTREEEARLDGWRWETSPVWREGVERVRRGREERLARGLAAGAGAGGRSEGYSGGAGGNVGAHGGNHYYQQQTYHHQPPRTANQKLVPRSAGEPLSLSSLVKPAGTTTGLTTTTTSTATNMGNPNTPSAGLAAMESRIRKDWAFLDEDPEFLHASGRDDEDHRGGSEDDEDGSFDDDEDEEGGEMGGSGSDDEDDEDDEDDDDDDDDVGVRGEGDVRRGLIDHLKLRGGKAPKSHNGKRGKGDMYHREMYGPGGGSGKRRVGGGGGKVAAGARAGVLSSTPNRKNVAMLMGAAVPSDRAGVAGGSKADRILGRGRYDHDQDTGGIGNENTPPPIAMRKLPARKYVPLMVAAGREVEPERTQQQEQSLLDLSSPVQPGRGIVDGVLGVLVGVVDPGMRHAGEARGQGGGGVVGRVEGGVGKAVREVREAVAGGEEWGGWGDEGV